MKMDRLRQLFAELGFARVRTYIQSGNVFFETDQIDRTALTASIEAHLRQALGYEVAVFLRTISELERVVASEAFHELEVTPNMRLCVVFTTEAIAPTPDLPMYAPKRDVALIATAIYEAFMVWYIVEGRPPAAQSFKAFTTLGTRTTTRFFHTTAKILAAAKQS